MTLKNLTTLDIENQRFKKKFKGYDPQEVQLFLHLCAEHYQALVVESQKLKEELARLKGQMEELQNRENIMKEVLYTAQKISDSLKDEAQKEASIVLKEAEVKSDELLSVARLKAHSVEKSIMDLKMEKESALASLKDLVSRLERIVESERAEQSTIQILPPKSLT